MGSRNKTMRILAWTRLEWAGRQSDRRAGRRLRFFVWITTATIALGFVLSFVKEVSVSLIGREDPRTRTHRELIVFTHPGVVRIEYWPSHRGHWDSESRKGPQVNASLGYPHPSPRRLAWFLPIRVQGGSSNGPFRGWLMPMSWPLIGLTGWSVWMVLRSHRSQLPGGCPNCGYPLPEQIPSTCPECGHKRQKGVP